VCELDESLPSGERIPYRFLTCKSCGQEIAKWKKPDDHKICFEELWYQRQYIFGKVPELSWELRHALR